jgi:isopenicillin-N N-acyltransferase-like protein
VRGKGYDRGLSQGQRFAALIGEHVTQYQVEPQWDEEKARIVSAIQQNLSEQVPDLYEEVAGIADGAGLPLRDVIGLNYWIEILQATVGFGCSLIGFADTTDGAIMAKNSDHDLPASRYLAQQQVQGDGAGDGFTFQRGTFVGTTSTRAGVNSAGLALCGAALVPAETNWEGVPIMALIDQILRTCASVGEAIDLAGELAPINYGANIMVGDRHGALALIERLPFQAAVRYPQEGVLFNTNHPLSSETAEHVRKDVDLMQSSQERFSKLQKLVPEVPRTPHGLKQVLADHTQPGAICQHGGAGWYTCASYLLFPARRLMLVADGSSCAAEYREYELVLT